MKLQLPTNSHNLSQTLFIEAIEIEELPITGTEFKAGHCKWRIVDSVDTVIIPLRQPYIRTGLPVMISKLWDKTDEHFVELLIEYLTPMALVDPATIPSNVVAPVAPKPIIPPTV
jgi:hypothetical protein